jgi:hypothetical protein
MGSYRTQAQWREYHKRKQLNNNKMGRTQSSGGGNVTYLGISKGAFYEGSGENKVFWKDDDGFSDGLTGTINKIEPYEFEYQGQPQKMVKVYIADDEGAQFEISAGKESRYIHNLLSRLINVNLDLPVVLTPYQLDSDGKTISGVSVKQDNKKVLPAFSRENPCPVEPNVYETKRGKEYDFEPQIDYMLEQIQIPF